MGRDESGSVWMGGGSKVFMRFVIVAGTGELGWLGVSEWTVL